MTLDKNAIQAAIKAKIVDIARMLGSDSSDLAADELIPATGYIDSAGLLDLIAWYEAEFDIQVAAEEFTIDNLGTLESMAGFVLAKKGLA